MSNDLKQLYFVSRAESLHTKNFVRTRKAFAVIYNSNEFNGGIYLTLDNGRELQGQELHEAYEIYFKRCKHFGIDVLPANFHLQDGGYKLYAGDITEIEIYDSVEDAEGKLIEESRKEVTAGELLA